MVQEFVQTLSPKFEETFTQFCLQRVKLKKLHDRHKIKNKFCLENNSKIEPNLYYTRGSATTVSRSKVTVTEIGIDNSALFTKVGKDNRTGSFNSTASLVSAENASLPD